MNPQGLIHSAASNIICSILFGTRYDYEDNVLSFIIKSFKENAEAANSAWAMVNIVIIFILLILIIIYK